MLGLVGSRARNLGSHRLMLGPHAELWSLESGSRFVGAWSWGFGNVVLLFRPVLSADSPAGKVSLSQRLVWSVRCGTWGISVELKSAVSLRLTHTKLGRKRLNGTVVVLRLINSRVWSILTSFWAQVHSSPGHRIDWHAGSGTNHSLCLVLAWSRW